MDARSPLSAAQVTAATTRLRSMVAQRLAVEEARLSVTITKATPPKGGKFAYEVAVRIDDAPPTDVQNETIGGLIQETLTDAVRWASAN